MLVKKMFGLGASDMQKQMSDPVKMQMLMQRGGFPWALAGLSLLPMLLGKGKADTIRKQMAAAHAPVVQRGGLPIAALLAKELPVLKAIGAPLAMGALASVGDNVVDKVFGKGDGNSQDGGLAAPRRRVGRVGRVGKTRSSKPIARRSGKPMKRARRRTTSRTTKGVSSTTTVREGEQVNESSGAGAQGVVSMLRMLSALHGCEKEPERFTIDWSPPEGVYSRNSTIESAQVSDEEYPVNARTMSVHLHERYGRTLARPWSPRHR